MSRLNASTGDRTGFVPPRQFCFLRIPAVLKRRGVCRSAHYADIKSGLYTKPVHIGTRAVAHPDYEVDALNAATIASKSPDEIRALVVMLEAARDASV